MANKLISLNMSADDVSDCGSTKDNSLSQYSNEDYFTSNLLYLPGFVDSDPLLSDSKKIRKKRNAYDKIDDNKRIKLVEAVNKGDTLKAASKKLGINYSSAKSIFHTYRTEGRISKKCMFNVGNTKQVDLNKENLSNFNDKIFLKTAYSIETEGSNANANSPMHELVNTFGNLSLDSQHSNETMMMQEYFQNFQPQIFTLYRDLLRLEPQIRNQTPLEEISYQYNCSCSDEPAFLSPVEQPSTHSTNDSSKSDYSYMTYSDSPLSERGEIALSESSDCESPKLYAKEFDTFSEMLDELQSSKKCSKQEIYE